MKGGVYLKHLRKIFSIILVGAMLFGIISLTGCSFLKGKNDSEGFSPIRLEKLEDTVDTVVEDYFNEKYGVEATVTYKNIAGGVFLGPDPSSVQYYLVTVNITDGDIENKYYVEVHGRETEGIDELYVKRESYYGQEIKEKTEEWLNKYVKQTVFTDYLIEFTGATQRFPAEYKLNLTAEDIISLVSKDESATVASSIYFILTVPKSEYEKSKNVFKELEKLTIYLEENNCNITVQLHVYGDNDYKQIKTDSNLHFELIESIELIGYE